ncbi:glycosyltransferase [Planctomycetota bacterium]
MRVALICDKWRGGGAAIAAARLATGLEARGTNVTRMVAAMERRRDGVLLCPPHLWSWLAGAAMRRLGLPAAARCLRPPAAIDRLRCAVARLRPDVVNIHNLHGVLNDPTVLGKLGSLPRVWTLHDMWSCTGRCTYSHDCEKYVSGCDAECPTPREYPALAPHRIALSWQRRQRMFEQLPAMVAVTPSRWLASVARRGLWNNHRVEVIPNGIDLSVFRPVSRIEARRAFGIPERGFVLMFAAADLRERRKGAAILIEALAGLSQRVRALILGSGKMDLPDHIEAIQRSTTDATEIAQAYNAADLFVLPSLADNLPNVLIEAIACGTPCVTMPLGGMPEVVRSGITGWLSQKEDPKALRNVLEEAIATILGGLDLRDSCRQIARAEYGLPLQAERYDRLFEELLLRSDTGRCGS